MTQSPSSSMGFVIHFLHPPSNLTLSYVAPPDGKVDLGTIARHFFLDPSFVRFNGHYLSRNHDFICSLTWRQVLNFFQSRGYSSGIDDQDPVRVEGVYLPQTCTGDSNVVVSEEDGLNHSGSQKLKRTAREVGIPVCNTGGKRIRQENISGTTSSVSDALTLLSKLKRRRDQDVAVSSKWGKRVRDEVSPDTSTDDNILQSQETKYRRALKRPVTRDEVSTDTALWKRIREIRV